MTMKLDSGCKGKKIKMNLNIFKKKNNNMTNSLHLREQIQNKKFYAANSWDDCLKNSYPSRKSHKVTAKNIFISLACLFLITSLTNCTNLSNQFTNPEPVGMFRGMVDKAPSGSVTFRGGWKDGCESGMAALGPLHYKAAYDYKYDENKLDSNEYHNAWRLGFRYCRWYTQQWTKEEW